MSQDDPDPDLRVPRQLSDHCGGTGETQDAPQADQPKSAGIGFDCLQAKIETAWRSLPVTDSTLDGGVGQKVVTDQKS